MSTDPSQPEKPRPKRDFIIEPAGTVGGLTTLRIRHVDEEEVASATGEPAPQPGTAQLPATTQSPAASQLPAAAGPTEMAAGVGGRGGRPPVFDHFSKDKLLDLIAYGISVPQAAAAVGCSVRTVYRWLAEDASFKRRYHDNRCQAQWDPLEILRRHANENWRAAAYLHEQASRNARKKSRVGDELPEDLLGQIEGPLRAMFGEIEEIVAALEPGSVRKRLGECLARHADILGGVMQHLWTPHLTRPRHDTD